MDGFQDALDGYLDVADGLTRYLLATAREEFETERDEFESRRERVREQVLDGIGGLPATPTRAAMAPETTAVRDRDGYSVELTVFESRSGFHVTANRYVPDGAGPFPAVLLLCGHTHPAKADPYTQRAAVELVANGFVVLVVDPVAQGERLQYRDPDTGETLVGGGGGVFAHCYAGQKCLHVGATLARYMVHDARCALSLLADDADVDADRIAVAGASGGGVQAGFLALLDDRVDAAAICCGGTDRQAWLETGKRIDAEQLIPAAIPRGINFDEFLTALAPGPLFVGAAASDEYFPIEGVHESFSRARDVYDLYDAREAITLAVADTTHCSVVELGPDVFEWFCTTVADRTYDPVGSDFEPVDATQLDCTSGGQVRAAYADERTIEDLIERDFLGDEVTGTSPADGPGSVEAAEVRESIRERIGLEGECCRLFPRSIRHAASDGLTTEHVFVKTERDPDVVVPGVLASTDVSSRHPPAVALFEGGTNTLPERPELVRGLARAHGTVFVVDPRGTGAVRNRAIPIPTWVDDYYGIYGTEFKLAYDALLLGRSLFGMRVFDACRAAKYLRSRTDEGRVSFVGEGVGAYLALYAAAASESVDRVEVRDLGPSFADLVRQHDVPFEPRLTAYDMVDSCDLPHVRAALSARDVDVVDRTAQ
jgi:dienelactone hydrolase